jgi:hypothetical protein
MCFFAGAGGHGKVKTQKTQGFSINRGNYAPLFENLREPEFNSPNRPMLSSIPLLFAFRLHGVPIFAKT